MTAPIKILGMSGSLRTSSFNTALLHACAALLPENATLEIADLAPLPMYNRDDDGENTPEVVSDFKTQIAEADAVIMATPEYNHSISGALKNAIDWASRRTPGNKTTVLDGKPLAIMGAATGQFGTVRAQQHLRLIAIATNMQVVQRPSVLVNNARDRFDADLNLTDTTTRDLIQDLLNNLVTLVERNRTLQATE